VPIHLQIVFLVQNLLSEIFLINVNVLLGILKILKLVLFVTKQNVKPVKLLKIIVKFVLLSQEIFLHYVIVIHISMKYKIKNNV
jgi:hypothetical protein